jgi:hypothetical protein
MSKQQPLTKARARLVLLQAREDIAMLMARKYEDLEEAYRLLSITTELYEGITGEEPPEFQVRPRFEVVA